MRFRKCHTPNRDSNPHSSIDGRLGKADVLTITPRVALSTSPSSSKPLSLAASSPAIIAAWWACCLVACLTSHQHASVSQGRICSNNFMCCHTEIEAADQTFYLTQSQYTDTGPTSPSADPRTPGAWQGSHWNASF